MRKDVNTVLSAIDSAQIDDDVQYERTKLEDIIDELNSESSTEYIFDMYFDLGEFSDLKRAVNKAIKEAEKRRRLSPYQQQMKAGQECTILDIKLKKDFKIWPSECHKLAEPYYTKYLQLYNECRAIIAKRYPLSDFAQINRPVSI